MKLLGKKLYMTSIFDENRVQVPVTVLEVGPCKVTQIKTDKNDGYNSIQIGYSETREKLLSKPKLGHLKKSGDSLLARLMEFRGDDVEKFKLGDTLTVDQFVEGEYIDITSRSKGRGFAGVVKKFNFRGGPKTHGQSDRLRTPGSVGASSYPSRVIKGKKMPGHYGDRNVTIRNLEVIKVDNENNLLLVKGSVPGSRNSYVVVSKG